MSEREGPQLVATVYIRETLNSRYSKEIQARSVELKGRQEANVRSAENLFDFEYRKRTLGPRKFIPFMQIRYTLEGYRLNKAAERSSSSLRALQRSNDRFLKNLENSSHIRALRSETTSRLEQDGVVNKRNAKLVVTKELVKDEVKLFVEQAKKALELPQVASSRRFKR